MTVLFGLTAAFSWAFSNVLVQRGSRGVDSRTVIFWVLLTSTVLIVPAALLVEGLAGPFDLRSLLPAMLAGVFTITGFSFLLKALRTGSLSVVSPIIATEGGFAAAMAIGLGERPGLLAIALLGIAIIGAVLVAIEPGRRTAAGAGWAVLAAICYAAGLIAVGLAEQGPLTIVAVTRLTSLVCAVPLFLLAARFPPKAAIPSLLGSGVLDAVGFTCFAIAASIGPLTVASVTASQWAIASAAIGIVLLRERLHLSQYVGIAVTVGAVTGLGLLI